MAQPKITGGQLNVGTGANQLIQLDGSSRLPAVDGSLLTNVAASAFRGAYVGLTGSPSIPSSVQTAIGWDKEIYDTDTIHDNVINNNRLIVPASTSYVQLQANIHWTATANTSTEISTALFKNGSSLINATQIQFYDESGAGILSKSAVISTPVLPVIPTDYFEIRVTQTSGVAQTVTLWSWFAMEILS